MQKNNLTKGERKQKKAGFGFKTFPVPFSLEESEENITITTNIASKPSKEQIIKQAFDLHSQGKIKEASRHYQYFINQGFNDHRVFSNYGSILKDLGKLQEAEIYTRKAIELKPDFADAYSNLGDILWELGHLLEAELLTRKAIQLNPNFANAYSNLGNILKDFGKLQDAELTIRKAIELNPDDAKAHYNLGNICRDLSKLKEAEISYRKAVEIKSDFAEAHCNMGAILIDLGKSEEAELSTRKAIKIKPNFADAHNNLGNILRDLGKQEEAEINYTKAIEIKANFNEALINRWQLFFDQGKFDLALKDSDTCNTKRSRALSLETLYALGNIEEIYRRIEATAELDSKNIDVAAFSSFLSQNEKKDTAHNFCKNPLSFLYFTDLKSHIKDYDQFIKEIIKELNDFPTIWQPRTTINGFQTPTTLNLFSKSSKYISQLKSIILDEIDSYYIKFKKESCLFIQQWPSKNNLVGWYNILKKQGYQKAHIHPSGWLSGVIYLKVVPSLYKDEGAIKFSLNGVYYSNTNSPELTFQPKLGDIVFFPSSLHHRTIPFSTDSDRIALAFDLKPN